MDNNVVTQLLALDRSDIERAKGTHMMALSKLKGQVFTFEIQALSASEMCEIQDRRISIEQATGRMDLHSFMPIAKTIIAGCPGVFQNNDIRKHYECTDFVALVNLLLTKDEAQELAEKIEALSGSTNDNFFDISDEDLKN